MRAGPNTTLTQADLRDHILRIPDGNEIQPYVGVHMAFEFPPEPIHWEAPAATVAASTAWFMLLSVELQLHFEGSVGGESGTEVTTTGSALGVNQQFTIARSSWLGGSISHPWELNIVSGLEGGHAEEGSGSLNLGVELHAPEFAPFGESGLTLTGSIGFDLISASATHVSGTPETDVHFGVVNTEFELGHLYQVARQMVLTMTGNAGDALQSSEAPHEEGTSWISYDGDVTATLKFSWLPNWPRIFAEIGRRWAAGAAGRAEAAERAGEAIEDALETLAEMLADGTMDAAASAALEVSVGFIVEVTIVVGIVVIGEHMLNDMPAFELYCHDLARQLFLYCYGYTMGRMGHTVRSAGAGSEQAQHGYQQAQEDMQRVHTSHPHSTLAIQALAARQGAGAPPSDMANFNGHYAAIYRVALERFQLEARDYCDAHTSQGFDTQFHYDLINQYLGHVAVEQQAPPETPIAHPYWSNMIDPADHNIGTLVPTHTIVDQARADFRAQQHPASASGAGTMTDAQRQTLLSRPPLHITGTASGGGVQPASSRTGRSGATGSSARPSARPTSSR